MSDKNTKARKTKAKNNKSGKKKSNDNIIVPVVGIIIVLLLLIVGVTIAALSSAPAEPQTVEPDTSYTHPDINISHYAEIDIENYGKITVALDASAAPETVANFVSLAESGFYDGLTFHRIMKYFMMQGGAGNDDSAQNIKGEFSANGFENNLKHVRGAISMARADDYNSASSQFFIMHADKPHLDGLYAAFGYVTEGIEVVDAICGDANPIDNNGTIAADKQPVIKSITVREAEK